MDESLFILLAYGTTGVLIAALCLATYLRARRVARQLDSAAK